MENSDILLTVGISILIMTMYNRYLIKTTLYALEERKLLTKRMGQFIKDNPNTSYSVKQTFLNIHHKSMNKSLLLHFIKRTFSTEYNEQEVEDIKKKIDWSDKELDFFKDSLMHMFKINFLYSPLSYIFYGITLFLVLLIPIFLILISSKLIGGFKVVDKFINRSFEYYFNPLNISRI